MPFSFKKQIVYGFVPLAIALFVIIKVFFFTDCAAFDKADDANHTFPNLFIARSIMRDGQIPMMNLYHNFGTPILGDATTYPFSPHALTYYFFPNPVAMTINRAAIAFLTVFALIFYLKKYMPAGIAAICAVVTFFSPGFLWHFAHHYYQLSLLCFIAILIFQERFNDKPNAKYLFLFYAAMVTATLSTSTNLVFLMIPFIVLNQLFLSRARFDKKMILTLIVIAAGFLFYYADFMNFFEHVKESARVGQKYLAPDYTFKRLLSGLIGQQKPWRHHMDSAIYFSLPLVTLSLIGLVWSFKNDFKKNIYFPVRFLILGIGPVIFVFLLLRFKDFYLSAPLLKSTDATRIWWISSVFFAVPAGIALDKISKNAFSKKFLAVSLAILAAVLLASVFWLDWHQIEWKYKFPVFFFLAFVILYAIYCLASKIDSGKQARSNIGLIFCGLLGLSLIWSKVTIAANILNLEDWSECCVSKDPGPFPIHHYSNSWESKFLPEKFLDAMTPNSRLAAEIVTAHGHDLRAAEKYVLGSAGRSILVNKRFADFLMKEKMIEVDLTPLAYHFVGPWDQEKVNRLGIKYILTGPRRELMENNWRVAGQQSILLLFENPEPVSIVYLQNGNVRSWLDPASIQIKGNGLKVKLPSIQREEELVATFIDLKGWKALVNGKERGIYAKEDRLMRIKVKPGDRHVSMDYEPFTNLQILFGVLASLALFWIGTRLTTKI